jgi:hypothetical protein
VAWPLAKVGHHPRYIQHNSTHVFSPYLPANKLWARANPYRSRHGRRTCAEVAIATAERIFTFQYDQNAGVAPYLSPEQQIANRGISRSALVQSPYGPDAGYDAPRSVGFSGGGGGGGGRRSRRGSWSYYDQPPGMGGSGLPPVGSIPIGGRGMGAYQNAQGYNIADAPMGVPFPQEMSRSRSPQIIPAPPGPDPYDDGYVIPTGTPGSYGGGGYPINAPGSYGAGGGVYPVAAPGSYGSGVGGYGSGVGGYGSGVGGYGAPAGGYGAGYEGAMLGPPQYRRQRSYSQGYRPGY